MITAKVEGLDEILRGLGMMEAEIPRAVDAYLVEAGQKLKSDVKRNTPIATGHLRRNVKTTRVFGSRRNRMLRVHDPVDYAIYKEKGHRTRDKKRVVEGHWMFKKAFERHIKLRPQRIQAFLLRRITKAGGFE